MNIDRNSRLGGVQLASENAVVVECRGPIVFHGEACCFRTLVLAALAVNDAVQLDLAAVPAIDAFGLATLVGIYSHARSHNKSLQIVSASPFVRNALELTKLDQLIGVPVDAPSPVLFREFVA